MQLGWNVYFKLLYLDRTVCDAPCLSNLCSADILCCFPVLCQTCWKAQQIMRNIGLYRKKKEDCLPWLHLHMVRKLVCSHLILVPSFLKCMLVCYQESEQLLFFKRSKTFVDPLWRIQICLCERSNFMQKDSFTGRNERFNSNLGPDASAHFFFTPREIWPEDFQVCSSSGRCNSLSMSGRQRKREIAQFCRVIPHLKTIRPPMVLWTIILR